MRSPAWIALPLALVSCASAGDEEAASTVGTSGAASSAGTGGAPGSTASSSAASSSAASTGSSSSAGVGGGGGSGGGTQPCTDTGPGEPNETEDQAYDLGTITDDDGDGGKLYGVLDGTTDVDWYVYTALDTALNTLGPTHSVQSDRGAARICVFFECLVGDLAPFTCPAAATPDTSPGGRPGCCGAAEFVVPGLGCSGTISDDLAVYLRVDADAQRAVCDVYTVAYHG